ncbi:hypothetical protein BDZ89DRAFT_506745 [Hymenopellis radicata]|nr:hypothetical protein BDZ89DRAFT_506745 [Hymenopellis radicata]
MPPLAGFTSVDPSCADCFLLSAVVFYDVSLSARRIKPNFPDSQAWPARPPRAARPQQRQYIAVVVLRAETFTWRTWIVCLQLCPNFPDPKAWPARPPTPLAFNAPVTSPPLLCAANAWNLTRISQSQMPGRRGLSRFSPSTTRSPSPGFLLDWNTVPTRLIFRAGSSSLAGEATVRILNAHDSVHVLEFS